ncbi:hypothetical protein GCM10010104_45700 [Streptomyces indiaensis]|uniref:Uncharacterized protein n=2 Tax=Streptomyces indiaensis TaxID=284033 RepID=A0ABN3DZ04_9ACTN
MKAVEVAVRDASGLDNSRVGVELMREAFRPHRPHENGKTGGKLANSEAEGGEQAATVQPVRRRDVRLQDPASHRTVDFDDPIAELAKKRAADLGVSIGDYLARLVQDDVSGPRARAVGAAARFLADHQAVFDEAEEAQQAHRRARAA